MNLRMHKRRLFRKYTAELLSVIMVFGPVLAEAGTVRQLHREQRRCELPAGTATGGLLAHGKINIAWSYIPAILTVSPTSSPLEHKQLISRHLRKNSVTMLNAHFASEF